MQSLRLDFSALAPTPVQPGAEPVAPLPGPVPAYADPPGRGYEYGDPPTAFDRGPVHGVGDPDFWRDGHEGTSPAKFRLKVQPGAFLSVRVYVFDAAGPAGVRVRDESGVAYALVGSGSPAYLEFDAAEDGDGVLTLAFEPVRGGRWVVNGLDVADAGTLPPPWA